MIAAIILIIFAICIFMFAKVDTKREVLGVVGLDIQKNIYESRKEIEYEKYCKKGILLTIEKFDVRGKDEKEFLKSLYKALKNMQEGCYLVQTGKNEEGQPIFEKRTTPFIGIKRHYIRFATVVVKRRIDSLKDPDKPILMNPCNYASAKDVAFYIKRLWDEYQYPWPEEWLQRDGI